MIIGHNEVKICPYDPQWQIEFEKEKSNLYEALEEFHPQIIHVGSTSIEDMPAKPIIDILILLPSEEEAEDACFKLIQNGFAFLGDGGRAGRFFLSDDKGDYPHYLHVTTGDNQVAIDQLRFQMILQTSEEIRRKYNEVKQHSAELFPNDRTMYRAMKSSFIDGVLQAYDKHQADLS